MTSGSHGLEGLARELREAFDRSFALPEPEGLARRGAPHLAIRIGEVPLALRLEDLAALAAAGHLEPLPPRGGPPDLLGLAGIRGRLVAAYDQAARLGLAAPDPRRRWLAVCASDPSVALAFDVLEGRFDVSESGEPAGAAGGRGPVPHVLAGVVHGDVRRGVIDVASILSSLPAP